MEMMCSIKRKTVDEVDGVRFKVPRFGFRLESESESDREDSRSESICSFQMEDTASPHDTSDTTDKSEEEYSLESLTEVEVPDVSSGSDDVCIVGNFNEIVSELGSDISVVADLSDSKSTSGDSEIGPADYWKCVMCNTTNKNPCVRYCEKCFRVRKNTLPPRPKSKKRQKKGKPTSSSGCSAGEGPSSLETQDSGLGLSQQSPDERRSEDLPADQICNSCYERPANGVFIHQTTGHQVFCYKCSQRIAIERNRCPYCNGIILRVIQLYRVNVLGEH